MRNVFHVQKALLLLTIGLFLVGCSSSPEERLKSQASEFKQVVSKLHQTVIEDANSDNTDGIEFCTEEQRSKMEEFISPSGKKSEVCSQVKRLPIEEYVSGIDKESVQEGRRSIVLAIHGSKEKAREEMDPQEFQEVFGPVEDPWDDYRDRDPEHYNYDLSSFSYPYQGDKYKGVSTYQSNREKFSILWQRDPETDKWHIKAAR